MKKLLLGVSLLVTASLLNASVVKEMGFVSVKYPQIKNVQDMNLLIDDVVEFIYDAFGDAMLKAIKNHRQRQTVHFKDIVYMGETLLPKRADEASIEKFYKAIDTTSLSEIAKQNGIEADFGALGENILIDVDIYHLKPTDRFKIGGALFEVTQNCTMCKSLAKIDSKLPKLLKNDRGIFVTLVSQKSKINLGDEVIVL